MGEGCFAVVACKYLCLIKVTGQMDFLGASVQSAGSKASSCLGGAGREMQQGSVRGLHEDPMAQERQSHRSHQKLTLSETATQPCLRRNRNKKIASNLQSSPRKASEQA